MPVPTSTFARLVPVAALALTGAVLAACSQPEPVRPAPVVVTPAPAPAPMMAPAPAPVPRARG